MSGASPQNRKHDLRESSQQDQPDIPLEISFSEPRCSGSRCSPIANGDEMTETTLPRKTPVRAAVAAWIGTTLEYYDFAVYGTSAALILNVLFFSPELPQGISVLLSMITFAVGYAVRPLGSLILGPMGDRRGRKFVMLITLFGIGGCTFLIGCLPTYAQIGPLAPVL